MHNSAHGQLKPEVKWLYFASSGNFVNLDPESDFTQHTGDFARLETLVHHGWP